MSCEFKPQIPKYAYMKTSTAKLICHSVLYLIFSFSEVYRRTQSKLQQPTTGTSEYLFLSILQPTELRRSPTYYHWYHVVVNSAVMIVAPSVIMVYCSHSVYRDERAT